MLSGGSIGGMLAKLWHLAQRLTGALRAHEPTCISLIVHPFKEASACIRVPCLALSAGIHLLPCSSCYKHHASVFMWQRDTVGVAPCDTV